jgi:polysaccharide deacetylase family protein (PEP-CTERM system associated)
MSVDLEEYYHAWALSSRLERSQWEACTSRIEGTTAKVLDLFAEASVTATFFVLGWVAQRHPGLVRDIAAQGHELASHGYAHKRVGEQDPDVFFEDVRHTRLLLEDLAGVPVNGFRAPNFSIDRSTWWAFERLAEAGYAYSSSVHPIRHDHYGAPDAPPRPFQPTAADLIEIPVSTIEVLGRRVSCAGGGHFRLLPYRWSRWCLDRFVNSGDSPAAFYFHPWELDPDQPRVSGLPLRARIRHYTHLGRMEDKLRRLLGDFRWGRFDEVFKIVPGLDSSTSEPCRQQRTA